MQKSKTILRIFCLMTVSILMVLCMTVTGAITKAENPEVIHTNIAQGLIGVSNDESYEISDRRIQNG